MAVFKDDPPNFSALERFRGVLISFTEQSEQFSKLLEHVKSIHGIVIAIFLVLAGIGHTLGVPIPWPGERASEPAPFNMPVHVPGTSYDGRNDPIVSTPRFADELQKAKPKATSRKLTSKVETQTDYGLIAAIGAFFAKLCGAPPQPPNS